MVNNMKKIILFFLMLSIGISIYFIWRQNRIVSIVESEPTSSEVNKVYNNVDQKSAEPLALIDHTNNENGDGSLWLVNPENPNEPLKVIKNPSGKDSVLIDNLIYFINSSTNQIYWMGFDGVIHALTFTDIPDSSITSFVISSDGSQLAWATIKQMEGNDVVKNIWVSDLRGAQKRLVFEEKGDQEDYLILKSFGTWLDNESILYFQQAHGGMGGYILIPVSWNLKMVDLQSGRVTTITEISDDIYPESMLSVSFKDSQMILNKIVSSIHEFIDLPLDPPEVYNFGGAGGAKFSPNGRFIAFMITQGDPEKGERYRVMVYDRINENLKTLTDEQGISYKQFDDWLSEEVLLLRGSDTVWTIRVDGSELTQIL